MRCDTGQPLVSAALDDPLAPADAAALADHLQGCADCRAFQQGAQALRRQLRFGDAADAPDVAPAVLAALPRRRPGPPRRLLAGRAAVAAAFAVGLVAGALVVGPGWRPPVHVAAADLPERVLAAQAGVGALTAHVAVVERGWHDAVPERRFSGALAYRAPESLALRLHDLTAYPSPDWPRGDVTVVVDGARSWSQGMAGCPRELLPGCLSRRPRTRSVTGREPFDEADPAPLDLVVPVRSFANAEAPPSLGARQLDGREAVGVEVTVAQVQPLLDAFTAAGAWRELHAADRVELWLDAATLVPLALDVLPASDADRALWAARRGYADAADRPYLSIALGDVVVDGTVGDDAFPPAPAEAVARDAGFTDVPGAPGPPEGLRPAWLPVGMAQHRTGVRRAEGADGPRDGTRDGTRDRTQVEVASWTDGRAWVVVRRVRGAPLARAAGAAARRVDLPRVGPAFVDRGGARVVVLVRDGAVSVSGSVGEPALRRIADSLDLAGVAPPAPDLPDGLLLASRLPGFAPAEPRVDAGALVLHLQGPGERSVVLAQARGERLGPPLDGDVRGVVVRGRPARHTPALGLLEWVEEGWVVSLRSEALGLAELVAVADQLVRR